VTDPLTDRTVRVRKGESAQDAARRAQDETAEREHARVQMGMGSSDEVRPENAHLFTKEASDGKRQ
jgi:hypothetical protein